MGRRYARVLPEPVSAWMKASESSARSCEMADFWMAVGEVRESFDRRWVASTGESPSEVKVCREFRRGAFDGVARGISPPWSSAGALEVGLEVKRDDTTSLVDVL
jgi:hypothetical protein